LKRRPGEICTRRRRGKHGGEKGRGQERAQRPFRRIKEVQGGGQEERGEEGGEEGRTDQPPWQVVRTGGPRHGGDGVRRMVGAVGGADGVVSRRQKIRRVTSHRLLTLPPFRSPVLEPDLHIENYG
jgi:hypothetical protein